MISYKLHHFLAILQVEDYEREIEEKVGSGKGKESNIEGTAGTTVATCGLGQCPIPPCSAGA